MICFILKVVCLFIIVFIIHKFVINPWIQLKYYRDQGFGPIYYMPFLGEKFFRFRDSKRKNDSLLLHKKVMATNPTSAGFASHRSGKVYLYLNSPELRMELITNRARYYKVESELKTVYLPLFGKKNILFGEEIDWKLSRMIVKCGFQTENIRKNFENLIRITQTSLLELNRKTQSTSKFNIAQYLQTLSSQHFLCLFFGEGSEKLQLIGDTNSLLVNELQALNVELTRNSQSALFKLLGSSYYKLKFLKTNKLAFQKIEKMRGELKSLIQNKRSHPNTEEKKDILSSFIEFSQSEQAKEFASEINDDRFVNEFLVLFYFAEKACSTLMAHAIYYLSQNDKVKENLISELLQNFPDGAQADVSSFSWEKIHSLQYMSAVFKEILRLSPPKVELGARVAQIDHRLGDIFIKKGTHVTVNMLNQNYNEKNFEQAEKFNPDRWIDEKPEKLDQSLFIPFSFGQHYCLGQNFCFMQVKLILTIFLLSFDCKTSPGQRVSWFKSVPFYSFLDPLNVELTLK